MDDNTAPPEAEPPAEPLERIAVAVEAIARHTGWIDERLMDLPQIVDVLAGIRARLDHLENLGAPDLPAPDRTPLEPLPQTLANLADAITVALDLRAAVVDAARCARAWIDQGSLTPELLAGTIRAANLRHPHPLPAGLIADAITEGLRADRRAAA